MKKLVLTVAIATIFGANAQTVEPRKAQPNQPVVVVKDLKEQDKEAYELLRKGGGKSGVMKSTVVVSDDGEESVIESSTKTQTKGTPRVEATKDASKKPVTFVSPATKKSDEALKVVPSDDGVLDAMDGLAKRKQSEAVDSKTDISAAPKKVEDKKQSPKKTVVGDKEMPEAGVKVTERVVRKEVTEKMVPPSDDVIYATLREQARNERNSLAPNGTANKNGDSDAAIVIDAIQGVNEIVTIAKNDMNRFVTPFEKVKVRTMASEEELVSKVDGNIVYLGATKRSGVFITEVGTDRAISLTLVPDDVPPRDIYIRLNRSGNIPAALSKVSKTAAGVQSDKQGVGSVKEGTDGKAQSHVDYVKELMRELALGKMPSGYSLVPPKSGEFRCAMPGFRMRLGQVVDGAMNKIMVFKAENTSSTREAVIDEQYCYKRGVVAVSAWPDVVVEPGGATEVFVVVRIDDGRQASSGRPSLIGRQSMVTDGEE